MPDVAILADAGVKHSTAIGTSETSNEAMDSDSRGLADILIVSGDETGKSASLDEIKKIKKIVPTKPIFVGSGLTQENARNLLTIADGAIVGTSIKKGRNPKNPVSIQSISTLIDNAF